MGENIHKVVDNDFEEMVENIVARADRIFVSQVTTLQIEQRRGNQSDCVPRMMKFGRFEAAKWVSSTAFFMVPKNYYG